ncbi:MAG: hypothetical protein E7235_04155 [Lachnospiraceae bacterium]|nr:hypothetical protein [Lachnospiraceae bacterium]
MEQPKLYEALCLINGHNDLNAEISATAVNLRNILTNKYISSLYSAIDESREMAEKHPSREIVLLKALKSYTSDHGSKQINNIINTLTLFNAVSNINHSIDNFSHTSVSALSKNNDICINHNSAILTKLLLLLAVSGKI